MPSRLNPLLFLICGLTDFGAYIVIFNVSRSLAEGGAEPWDLGVAGGGYSFSAGVGSLLGGWMAHRYDGRIAFVGGAISFILSIAICALADPGSFIYLPGYWLLGIGLGWLYPPLIGWLNQGEDAHANRRGVSHTLVVYCVSWNVGMMAGQLSAGSLFARGAGLAYAVAFGAALVNLILTVVAARRVAPLAPVDSEAAPGGQHAQEVALAFKRLSWLANLGCMFGASLVIHLLPDLAVSLGVRPENHGELLAAWRAVVILTYIVMHHVAFWHYRLSIALISQFLAAIGLVAIAEAGSAVALFIGLVLLGQLVGYNYLSGVFYSTAGSSHAGRALAAGIHEATLATGMAAGTITLGAVATLMHDHRIPYLIAAAAMIVLIVVQTAAWWRWVKPLHKQDRVHLRPDDA